jgi:hypothetical protein
MLEKTKVAMENGRKSKWQWRMDNLETLATLGIRHRRKPTKIEN